MAPTQTDAIGALSERSKVERLLNAARSGDLAGFKEAVRFFTGEQGSAQDIEAVKDAHGRGPLHFSSSEGKLDICRHIIEGLKLSVDPRDEDALEHFNMHVYRGVGSGIKVELVAVATGDTPLIHAARKGHSSTAEFLLDHGADAFATSLELSATALHHAASTGCLELIDSLLEKGVSIDVPSDAGPPLIWAAGSGKNEAVKLLLDRGADPNAASEDDVTPLFSAAAAGATESVKLLVQGANVNIRAGGATPLHVAGDYGDVIMVNCLLKHGADPNAVDDDNVKPIHAAAARGHRSVVELLLPVTDVDSKVRVWTVDGIMSYADNENAAAEHAFERKKTELKEKIEAASVRREKVQVSPVNVAKALEAKARGTDAFRKKDFEAARDAYTQAIDFDPNNAELFSNRSLCWIRLGQAEHAVADAQTAREIRPDWSKACYREGSSLLLLQRYEEAAQAFYDGVKLDPENKELVDAFKAAVKAGKESHGTV